MGGDSALDSADYLLVSVPKGVTASSALHRVEAAVGDGKGVGAVMRFDVPETLRVGTLDGLLELADDLARADTAVEQTVRKVARQMQVRRGLGA